MRNFNVSHHGSLSRKFEKKVWIGLIADTRRLGSPYWKLLFVRTAAFSYAR